MKLDLKKELDLAVIAALRAGKYLRELKEVEVKSEKGKDIKLKADKESEKIILNYLKNSKHSILSEEDTNKKKKKTKIFWIVDPLDGSLNFKRKLPHCAVSIALWKENEPLLGVIYDFNKDDLYSAIVGKGVWLNGEKISVSKISSKNQGVIATGLPPEMDHSDENLLKLLKYLREFKKTRLFGCPALSIAYIAAGKLDAYTEEKVKIWDVAAGLALLKEAGGEYSIKNEDKKYQITVVATNGKIKI